MKTDTTPEDMRLLIDKVPITRLFQQKIISKPTLYAHVRAGKFNLYKLGSRSYVDIREFNASFRKVEIGAIQPVGRRTQPPSPGKDEIIPG